MTKLAWLKVASTVRNQKQEGLKTSVIMVVLAAHLKKKIPGGAFPQDPPAQSTQHIIAYDVW